MACACVRCAAGNKLLYKFVVPSDDANAAGLWGVAFTVTATGLTLKEKEALVVSHADRIGYAVKPLVSLWSPEMDTELCELARRICQTSAILMRTVLTLPVDELCIRSQREALALPSISAVPVPQLRLRFALLQHFNARLQSSLHCFEFHANKPWTTGCVGCCSVCTRVGGMCVCLLVWVCRLAVGACPARSPLFRPA